MPTWPGRRRDAARVELGAGRRGIGEMAADGLDPAESELGQRLELAVEVADSRAGE